MPRARGIKPQFFKHDGLADVSRDARLLFIGLWTLADFKGRLKDKPRWIRAEIFPYDGDADVESWLDELASHSERFIVRYEAKGEQYIEIPGFTRHQNPHKREKEGGSTIPPNPDLGRDKAGIDPGQDPASSGSDPGPVPTQTGTSPADSCNLIPDQIDHSPNDRKTIDVEDEFSDWWEVYPRRVAKAQALKAYQKARKQVSADVLLEGVEAYKRNKPVYADWKHPATWLNGGCWEDDYGQAGHGDSENPNTEPELSEHGQRARWMVANFSHLRDRHTGEMVVTADLVEVAPGAFNNRETNKPVALVFFDPVEEAPNDAD